MKPPPFDYIKVESSDEAVDLLAEYGNDAKIIAGGQSLMPMLNMRLVRPQILIDISMVAELNEISRKKRGQGWPARWMAWQPALRLAVHP